MGQQARIYEVDPGLGGLEHCHSGHAAGVVRLKLDRNSHSCLQGCYQHLSIVGRKPTLPVLDADAFRTHLFQGYGLLQEVVQGIEGTAEAPFLSRRVAEGELDLFPSSLYGTNCGGQVSLVIQCVVEAEDLDPALGGVLYKGFDHVVGVDSIANQVLPAEEHLERRARHSLLEGPDTLPGVIKEDPGGQIKGGAVAHVGGVEAHLVHILRDRLQALGRHSRLGLELEGIPKGGVGDSQGGF